MSGRDDADEPRRRFQAPYTPKHQIPTIQRYREEKENRLTQARSYRDDEDDDDATWSKTNQARDTARRYFSREQPNGTEGDDDQGTADGDDGATQRERDNSEEDDGAPKDTSEVQPMASDPKARRKGMKKRSEQRAEREVTDPVTHLPVRIFDFTSKSLREIEENDPPFGTTKRTATGFSNKTKSDEQLGDEQEEMRRGQEAFNDLFPPPAFDSLREELAGINKLGMTVGLIGTAVIILAIFVLYIIAWSYVAPVAMTGSTKRRWILSISTWLALAALAVGGIWALNAGVSDWVSKRMDSLWEEEIWESNRQRSEEIAKQQDTESTRWLNSLLGSVWPLVNPDLFTSLADTLEDVMQASLPRIVRMVSVDDIGQGSESLRILGVRWLPTGAAARSVSGDGKLKKADDNQHENDRSVPGEGEVDQDAGEGEKTDGDGEDNKDTSESKEQVAEGMEAEEGDFVNLEVAFAYRARSQTKTVKDRMKDMHLYLAFYLPGNIKIPVWVDLKGVVGTMRMRLQLAPDPPFFALCTVTFLGQPKVDIRCQPLSRKGLNIMDVPLISNFVQSAVDAAMAEYVAPKSLTLDLKDMLAGDDFKKDTTARGVLVIKIIRGYDFKVGDMGIPLIKDGSADPYVSVGWAKFGKALWSTRLLQNEMEPVWQETAYLLVTPEELNVDERLRVQLWDSDRFTADDDLGRIEVGLKQLMKDSASNGKMAHRCDGFRALQEDENMPGKLEWEVGYFSKVRIQPCQLQAQTYDTDIRTMEQLKQKVSETSERKLRETLIRENRSERDEKELDQQKAQELKLTQDSMMISAPPPEDYPSGIFSIQIHQITGLELETQSKVQSEKNIHKDDEEETGDTLPSAYCNVIINHRKVFKTRTKPKNAKPFFNAGTEKFIGDWNSCEVHISVRDARVHEDDPLLGIVHLPLAEIFKNRSQVNGFYPIAGGVGFGRVRLSMVWRSIQLQAPPESLGWELGTLEVLPEIKAINLPEGLGNLRLKVNTNLGSGKLYPSKHFDGWKTHKGRSLRLAVHKRYASCFTIRFRDKKLIGGNNAAFGVFWLRHLIDERETEIEVPVWKGNFDRAIASSLEDCGERIGTVKIKVKFWSGLGGAHHKWASKDPDLKNVLEVLDVARENVEAHKAGKKAGINVDSDDEAGDRSQQQTGGQVAAPDDESNNGKGDDDSSSDDEGSASDSDSDNNDDDEKETQGDGKGWTKGWADTAMEYKKNRKDKHRRHRGIMQWKVSFCAQTDASLADDG